MYRNSGTRLHREHGLKEVDSMTLIGKEQLLSDINNLTTLLGVSSQDIDATYI